MWSEIVSYVLDVRVCAFHVVNDDHVCIACNRATSHIHSVPHRECRWCVCFVLSLILEIHAPHTSSSKQNILSLLVAEVSENFFPHNLIGYRRAEGRGKQRRHIIIQASGKAEIVQDHTFIFVSM